MAKERSGFSRREFLKQGSAAGLGLMAGPSLAGMGWSATKDLITVFHGTGLDSVHPYNHSNGPLYVHHIVFPVPASRLSLGSAAESPVRSSELLGSPPNE